MHAKCESHVRWGFSDSLLFASFFRAALLLLGNYNFVHMTEMELSVVTIWSCD